MTQKILLIDLGNSNIKWAWVLSADEPLEILSASHRDIDVVALGESCWGSVTAPQRVLMANVAGMALEKAIDGWMDENWGLSPEIIRPQAKAFGVTLAYQQPQQLGVDRWLTLIAAHAMGSRPVCIVDSGTALTIDVIDAGGRHLGGQILPGFEMMHKALLAGTRIPAVEPVAALSLLGAETASCIASGSLHAAGALVDRVMARTTSMTGIVPKLMFTGSGAPLLMKAVEHTGVLFTDLVMQGLRRVAGESIRP